jgi:hypothetical protein
MSSSFGTERSSTRRPTGTIIAPPMPCRKRAATNAASVPDTAHNSDPATNTTMALANTVREPMRSATQPLIGMNTARPTRYEVSASLSASGLSPISAAIAGSEVAITVESMFSMKSEQATMSGMRTVRCTGRILKQSPARGPRVCRVAGHRLA